MQNKTRNVQILDAEKLDENGLQKPRTRRHVHRRHRELLLKGLGLTLKFKQDDEEGSEEQ